MTFTESLAARRIYELERQQPGRSYASEHEFEEWLERYLNSLNWGSTEGRTSPQRAIGSTGKSCGTGKTLKPVGLPQVGIESDLQFIQQCDASQITGNLS